MFFLLEYDLVQQDGLFTDLCYLLVFFTPFVLVRIGKAIANMDVYSVQDDVLRFGSAIDDFNRAEFT